MAPSPRGFVAHIYKLLGADGRFFGFGAFLAAPEKLLCPD